MDFGPFKSFHFPTENVTEVKKETLNIINREQEVINTAPVCFNPTGYSEAESIADSMINGKNVIVNLEIMLNNESKKGDGVRVVDYLCGVAHTLKMEVIRINGSTFYFNRQ